MSVYYARNTSGKTVTVKDIDHKVLTLAADGSSGDRAPVSELVLARPDVQRLWSAGTLAVYADDDYETVVPYNAPPQELRHALWASYIASLITDPDHPIGAAIAAMVSGGGTAAPTWDTLEGRPEVVAAGATAAAARTSIGIASDAAAGTASMRTLGTTATSAAPGNHTHAALTGDAVPATASTRTLGPGPRQAAAGDHTHANYASSIAALESRVTALETP